MFKKILILLFGSVVFIYANMIKIAVATNVSYAIGDLKKEFHKLYPNIQVEVILGSSGKLTAQIKNGAPYQLFMAANMRYPRVLYKDGYAINKPVIYAQGGLAYLSSKKVDFKKKIKLLLDSNIKTIAVANPQIAPYGKAAIEAMKNGGVYNKVKSKLIYAQSVSQAVAYSISAADIGFVAKSSLFSPKMKQYKKGVNWEDVNVKLYNPINQGIVILKNGKNNKSVKVFYKFILSKKAKKILQKFGYLVP